MQPLIRPGALRRASAKLMGHDLRTVTPKTPKPGSFGIATKTSSKGYGPQPHQYETMDRAKWKQTAKDLPLVALAGGAGYGVGKTIGDAIGEAMATRGVKASPMVRALAPMIGSGLTAAGGYLFGQTRAQMRQRREEASQKAKSAGVAPAPQSRRIPRKKPSDPWKYDPRPAGGI